MKSQYRWPPLCDTIIVSKNCHDALMYVSSRSRWSKDLESRLLKADKIKEFDWSSVPRGEEDEELRKHGIMPAHEPDDLVNPWPNARPECVSLLTSLFKEGKLTYALQDCLLKVDGQLRCFSGEDNEKASENFIRILLGKEFQQYAPFFVSK